ncbi:MAG: TadE/TadG family type IV pilus assembly protein [Dehalococcoidia bacterium]
MPCGLGAGRRRRGREDGQSLVELALVLPIFLLLLFGIVDFGMGFQSWITVTNSSREGARLGAVGADSAAIEARVRQTADSLDQAQLSVAVTNAGGPPGESVVVEASYNYSFITPLSSIASLVSGGTLPATLTLSSTAEMRLE